MIAPTTQELFKQTRDEWIDEARHAAQELLLKRPTITIEDVLLVKPRPSYLGKNVTGCIFQSPIFRSVGYTRSRQKSSHGHLINIWSLRVEFFPDSAIRYRRRNVAEYGD